MLLALTALRQQRARLGVKGRERVVQQEGVGLSIQGPRQTQALLLAARDVDAAVSQLCLVPACTAELRCWSVAA